MDTEQSGQWAIRLDLLKILVITLAVPLYNAELSPGGVIDNVSVVLCTSAALVSFMITGVIQLNWTDSINYRQYLASISRLCALMICWKIFHAAPMYFLYVVPIDDSLSNFINYIFLS